MPPTELTLLALPKVSGYYHVRTSDGQDGWVWGRNVSLEDSHEPIVDVSTAAMTEGNFSPAWAKPPPNTTQFTGPSGTCGPTGDGGDRPTNRLKNRTDVPTVYHDVSFTALASLPYPVAPKHRADWSADQLDEIEPHEGRAVRVSGYLVALKPQTGGTGESTNCHFTKAAEVDWHVALVEDPGDGEKEAVVIETTPRVRRKHPKWTKKALDPWVDTGLPVRISGWTMLDPEHRNHLGKYRSTLWEIHPITEIEVFRNNKWVDLDELP